MSVKSDLICKEIKKRKHNAEIEAKAYDWLDEVMFELAAVVAPSEIKHPRAMWNRFQKWLDELSAEDKMGLEANGFSRWASFVHTELEAEAKRWANL